MPKTIAHKISGKSAGELEADQFRAGDVWESPRGVRYAMRLSDAKVISSLREIGITGHAADSLLENARRKRVSEYKRNQPSGATHYRETIVREVQATPPLSDAMYVEGEYAYQEVADGLLRIEWFKQNDGGPGASWFIWGRQYGWKDEMGWEEYRQYSGQRPERLVFLSRTETRDERYHHHTQD